MRGESYIKHIPPERIQKAVNNGLFSAVADFGRVKECDTILIAVPTPLSKNREPDVQYITASCEAIAPYVRKGQLIILESSTYPGTTDEVMIPILERGGLKVDRDFFAAFSPEREDPANKDYRTETIPKVVGATYLKDWLLQRNCISKLLSEQFPFHQQERQKQQNCWKIHFGQSILHW